MSFTEITDRVAIMYALFLIVLLLMYIAFWRNLQIVETQKIVESSGFTGRVER